MEKATTTTDRIKPAPWQVLVSDVAARVDGLQSAWRAVCDSLAASGIPAVTAAHACAVLTVAIAGHPLAPLTTYTTWRCRAAATSARAN